MRSEPPLLLPMPEELDPASDHTIAPTVTNIARTIPRVVESSAINDIVCRVQSRYRKIECGALCWCQQQDVEVADLNKFGS